VMSTNKAAIVELLRAVDEIVNSNADPKESAFRASVFVAKAIWNGDEGPDYTYEQLADRLLQTGKRA